MPNYFYILLIIAFTSLVQACQDKTPLLKVEQKNISKWVYSSGTTISEGQYQVTSDVSGKIVQLNVKEGDIVSQNQVLITLDASIAKIQSENAIEQTKINSKVSTQLKINELQTSLETARLRCTNDSALYTRQQKLWKEGIGSKIELEQKDLAYQNAKRTVTSLELKLADLKTQLFTLEKQSRNNANIANINYNNFFIKSMVNGKVYSILHEPGEFITPSTPLAIVGNNDIIKATMQVDEEDVSNIKIGQKVAIKFESFKDSTYSATLSRITPYINPKTRTFEVEALFDTKPNILLPNLSFEANILVDEKKDALVIPIQYLLNDTTVIDQNNAQIKVKTGIRDYKMVEILSGLTKETLLKQP